MDILDFEFDAAIQRDRDPDDEGVIYAISDQFQYLGGVPNAAGREPAIIDGGRMRLAVD
jgi:hypothetical protein